MSFPDLLTSEKAPWLNAPALERIFGAVELAGGEVRAVGGAVRDALLEKPVQEVDLACTLPPDQTTAALEKAGIKVVPTGIEHGTVTAVIDRKGYEITTLRKDIETDGRHAKVVYTQDWAEDAARRDFTFNALYVDRSGRLYDYGTGREDLAALRVRFIGDPRERLREDVLRLLRFFRFLAQMAGEGKTVTPDEEALRACREAAPLLPGLSAERVWREFGKLLQTHDPVPVLMLMKERGILDFILPEATRPDRLKHLIIQEKAMGCKPDPVRRLAALLEDGHGEVAFRLRLSKEQSRRLGLLGDKKVQFPAEAGKWEAAQLLYDHGLQAVRDAAFMAMAEGREDLAALLPVIETWEKPIFPLQGQDLLDHLDMPPGPEVGACLLAVESWWREQGFKPTRDACLAKAKELVSD